MTPEEFEQTIRYLISEDKYWLNVLEAEQRILKKQKQWRELKDKLSTQRC